MMVIMTMTMKELSIGGLIQKGDHSSRTGNFQVVLFLRVHLLISRGDARGVARGAATPRPIIFKKRKKKEKE